MSLRNITYDIRGAAFKVHRALGSGLLESAYEACLLYELAKLGFNVQQQVSLPLFYDNIKIEVGYRIDLLVEEQVIVELKAVEKLLPIHTAQVLSYLRLSKLPVGLLMNFNCSNMQHGIQRFVM